MAKLEDYIKDTKLITINKFFKIKLNCKILFFQEHISSFFI